MTANRVFATVGALAAAAAVAVGLYISGSPAEQRLRRLDEQRIEDLRGLSAAIDEYRVENGVLPETLDDVVRSQRLRGIATDPVTESRYDYEIADNDQYRLCAEFSKPSEEQRDGDFWWHDAGRRCFTIAPRPD